MRHPGSRPSGSPRARRSAASRPGRIPRGALRPERPRAPHGRCAAARTRAADPPPDRERRRVQPGASAAKSARPRKSAGVGSSARTVPRRAPPSTSGSSPSTSPGPSSASSTSRRRGAASRRRRAPRCDDVEAVGLLALTEEHLAGRARRRCRTVPELLQLLLREAGEQRHLGEEREGGSELEVGDLRRHRAVSSDAVRIEYSGASSHVDVSVVSGSDAIISDSACRRRPSSHSPSRST